MLPPALQTGVPALKLTGVADMTSGALHGSEASTAPLLALQVIGRPYLRVHHQLVGVVQIRVRA